MRKVGLLILALVIALGALGVGYAKWSDTVAINGSINSGTLCMTWATAANFDPCSTTFHADPKYAPAGVDFWDKDVACTTVTLSPDGKTATVVVTNAYPGYYNDIEMEYINCGTIPIKISSFNITPVDFVRDPTPDWTVADGDGQIWIDWTTTGVGFQFHPGEKGTSSFKMLVSQDAAQDATYTFTITIVGAQWNEVP